MRPDLVIVLRSYGLNGLKKTKAGVSPADKSPKGHKGSKGSEGRSH